MQGTAGALYQPTWVARRHDQFRFAAMCAIPRGRVSCLRLDVGIATRKIVGIRLGRPGGEVAQHGHVWLTGSLKVLLVGPLASFDYFTTKC